MESASDLAPSAGLWSLPRSRRLARSCLLSPALRGAGPGPAAWRARGAQRRAVLCGGCRSAAERARGAGIAELAAGLEELAAGLEAVPGGPQAEGEAASGEGDLDTLEKLAPPGACPLEDLARACAAVVPHIRLRHWLKVSLAAAGVCGEDSDCAASCASGALAEEAEALLDASARAAAPPDAADTATTRFLVAVEGPFVQALQLELADLEFAACAVQPPAAEGEKMAAEVGAPLMRAARITPPRVLIVAGSDSGGGAGIQADLKSCAAMGAFGMTAIAALTAQNTQGVQGIFPVPVDFVQQQMRSVLDDIGADVVKTGMLATSETVAGVARGLLERAGPVEQWRRRVVLDPVMVSTSGHVLLQEDAIASVKSELFPMATIITPNLPEAELLLGGRKIETVEAMRQAARDLCDMGPAWALVKGGHLKADEAGVATDVLCCGATGDCELLTSQLVRTTHTHGTGCTLASSIAALLARGCAVPEAVRGAKRYVSGAIEASAHLALGSGPQGPMNHSWELVWW